MPTAPDALEPGEPASPLTTALAFSRACRRSLLPSRRLSSASILIGKKKLVYDCLCVCIGKEKGRMCLLLSSEVWVVVWSEVSDTVVLLVCVCVDDAVLVDGAFTLLRLCVVCF